MPAGRGGRYAMDLAARHVDVLIRVADGRPRRMRADRYVLTALRLAGVPYERSGGYVYVREHDPFRVFTRPSYLAPGKIRVRIELR